MTDPTPNIQIRPVSVEFLRPGPSHNQLLSPFTQYLAICNDAGAGVVTVPYEQRVFERRLKELRYETGDAADRVAMLNEIGTDMAKILGSVPGLPGALMFDANQPATLVHLRLTLSAAELALLPFELAKVPVGPAISAESWLSIQLRPAVCVTRNIRTVSPEGVLWPGRPRILFIAGDTDNTPYAEHRSELLKAIRPFQYPERDDRDQPAANPRQQFGDLLTILVNPTLAEILRECGSNPYTHIHILTHGDLDQTSHESYGLVLRGPEDEADVVTGDRFATAITSVEHRPTVVTVASCDSGNVGSVVIPGASFAHALHQAGIPLVIAAQFPLSKEGSIPLTGTLYNGLLWGQHPLPLLQKLRAELHARYTANWHDWASLVVYEALPRTLDDQLDALRYFQSKRAINAALERIDTAVAPGGGDASLADLDCAVDDAVSRLPLNGQYAMECVGLRASARKRLAQAAFTLASDAARTSSRSWHDSYDLLDQARVDYDTVVGGLLVNDARATQRLATLHWVTVQLASLTMVLGNPAVEGVWETARLCAERYADHPDIEQRAWAHGSLAELCLVRLGERDLSAAQRKELRERALSHADELNRLYPWYDDFPVKSTRRQFERYITWWGTAAFETELVRHRAARLAPWEGEYGLIATAREVVTKLQRKAAAVAAPSAPSASPVKPGSGTSLAPPAAPVVPPVDSLRMAARQGGAPFFDVDVLAAGHGDSLWIEYGQGSARHRWLIDCGTQGTSKELLRRVEALPTSERFLELFILSHIDSDHIGGALPFFRAVQRGLRFGDVWFNGWRQLSDRLGAKQGEMFSTALEDFSLPWNVWQDGRAIVVDRVASAERLPEYTLPGGMTLTLLSPTRLELAKLAPVWTREMRKYGLEPGSRVDYGRFLKGVPSTSTDIDELASAPFGGDAGAPNGTSIAVLAEFGRASMLFAADAHAPVLVTSLKALIAQRGGTRLKVDAFKVSHHGSQNNVSSELIQLLECPRYILSTNGEHFGHPDRQAIARIIKHGGPAAALYFNYTSQYNEVWGRRDLQERYGFTAHYPAVGESGLTLSLLPDAEVAAAAVSGGNAANGRNTHS